MSSVNRKLLALAQVQPLQSLQLRETAGFQLGHATTTTLRTLCLFAVEWEFSDQVSLICGAKTDNLSARLDESWLRAQDETLQEVDCEFWYVPYEVGEPPTGGRRKVPAAREPDVLKKGAELILRFENWHVVVDQAHSIDNLTVHVIVRQDLPSELLHRERLKPLDFVFVGDAVDGSVNIDVQERTSLSRSAHGDAVIPRVDEFNHVFDRSGVVVVELNESGGGLLELTVEQSLEPGRVSGKVAAMDRKV